MGRNSKHKKKPILSIKPSSTNWLVIPLLSSMFLFIRGGMLADLTFIPLKDILLVILSGGSLMVLAFILAGILKHPKRFSILLINFSLGGSLGLFLLAAINYYPERDAGKTVQLPILKTGSTKSSTGNRLPNATVLYDDVRRKVQFSNAELELVPTAKMVELTLERGVLGYYIYMDQKLIQ